MSRFTIQLSERSDSRWQVENWAGVPVAWFETTTAAERWIAEREREARADVACVSNAEKRRAQRREAARNPAIHR